MANRRERNRKTGKRRDPLDEIWLDLVKEFDSLPMNYGDDIRAVGHLAIAAGIAPCRAIARVKTFYFKHRTMQ